MSFFNINGRERQNEFTGLGWKRQNAKEIITFDASGFIFDLKHKRHYPTRHVYMATRNGKKGIATTYNSDQNK